MPTIGSEETLEQTGEWWQVAQHIPILRRDNHNSRGGEAREGGADAFNFRRQYGEEGRPSLLTLLS